MTLDDILRLIEERREHFAHVRDALELRDNHCTGVLNYVIRELYDVMEQIKAGRKP